MIPTGIHVSSIDALNRRSTGIAFTRLQPSHGHDSLTEPEGLTQLVENPYSGQVHQAH